MDICLNLLLVKELDPSMNLLSSVFCYPILSVLIATVELEKTHLDTCFLCTIKYFSIKEYSFIQGDNTKKR